jgi:hypothetical protein
MYDGRQTMRIAIQTPFTATRKEPLAEMAARIRKAFLDIGHGEPFVRFTLADSPAANSISAIDRALKRHPEMNRFVTNRKLGNRLLGGRILSNALSDEPFDYATLEAIAAGVPRSFPFHSISLHFYVPEFGERLIGLPAAGHSYPGILITDNWWVSGRQRALNAYTVVEMDATDKKLPAGPPRIDALIKKCGKPKKAIQVRIPAPGGGLTVSIPQANIEAVKIVTLEFKARLAELVEAAAMPHELPSAAKAFEDNVGILAGPRKPALEAAFKPMGYSCTGGNGVFHLARRTEGNHTAELYLDVGTWSHMVSARFSVHGAGFQASLEIPIAPHLYGQYPIGDAEQWQKIVENLAAMVRELERTFVPGIEEVAGPSPAWFEAKLT